MIYIPLIGAIALSVMVLFEKLGLKKNKINSNHFMVAAFLSAVVFMLFFLPFFGGVDKGIFELKNILYFIGVIFFAVVANICYFYAMKWEKLSTLEPVHLLEPLFVIILASIFFSAERNTHIIIPAIIAALALVFSHVRKHHLNFNKYVLVGILGSFLYGVETIFAKLVLDYFTPLSLYFFRCLFILIITAVMFRPRLTKEIKGKNWIITFVVGISWVVYKVLSYYGFIKLGVVFTTLILMLSPVLVYAFAWKFLKEKLEWRNIVAAIVIIICVLYGVLG